MQRLLEQPRAGDPDCPRHTKFLGALANTIDTTGKRSIYAGGGATAIGTSKSAAMGTGDLAAWYRQQNRSLTTARRLVLGECPR
jgi:hypothetical protein